MKPPHTETASKLKDPDIEVRLQALKSLTGFYDAVSVEWIVDALGDSEWRVRKTAVAMIVDLKDKDQVIDQLIGRLRGEKNVGMQNSAVEVFIQLGKLSVDRLLHHLPGADENIKKFIIDTLGEIKDPRSVPSLIDHLSEHNENVQASSIEALGKIREATVVPPLLKILKEDQSLLKFSAIKALGQIEDVQAVAPLIEILDQNMFKRPALEALGAIGDMKALDALVAAFSSGYKATRYTALKAIVTLESKQIDSDRLKIKESVRAVYSEEVYTGLMEALNGSDKPLKVAGIKMLGWLYETRSIPMFISLLSGEDENDITNTLIAMGKKAVMPIVSVLSGQDERVREKVAFILGNIRSGQAVPTLLELLKDNNGHVRSASATALGRINDPSAIPLLFKVLADPYPDVQEAAVKALMEMNEHLPASNLIELLKDDSPHLRCNAALLLGQLKKSETIPPLSFLLKDPDEHVRRSAVHALGFFDSPEIVPHLVVAFGDEDHRVRLAALKIIERLGAEETKRVVDYLIPLLHDQNIWVRSAIPRILGRVSDERVLKLLIELLNDEVGAVKISVLSMLADRKIKRALPSVLEQTLSSDPEVKKAAIHALGKLGDPSVFSLLRSFLSDPHWTIRASAAQAVGELRDKSSHARLEEMTVADADTLVREAARNALTQIGRTV